MLPFEACRRPARDGRRSPWRTGRPPRGRRNAVRPFAVGATSRLPGASASRCAAQPVRPPLDGFDAGPGRRRPADRRIASISLADEASRRRRLLGLGPTIAPLYLTPDAHYRLPRRTASRRPRHGRVRRVLSVRLVTIRSLVGGRHRRARRTGLMLGHSHALSGAVTGAATGIFLHLSEPRTIALAGFTAGMALLPDLDKCGSSPARCLGFLSEAVAKVIAKVSGGHRHADPLDPGHRGVHRPGLGGLPFPRRHRGEGGPGPADDADGVRGAGGPAHRPQSRRGRHRDRRRGVRDLVRLRAGA